MEASWSGRPDETGKGWGPDVGRRRFLQWSAIAAGGVGLAACAEPVDAAAPVVASALTGPADRVVWNACLVNCGSRCPLRF